MTKAVLMERLTALGPKPRQHLVTYHGCSRRRQGCGRGWCRGEWGRKAKPAVAGTAQLAGAGSGVVRAAA